ncbi:MAG: T9SS type A sorting domain-containing protein [Candidatus Cloacimonetes bacterium]|nr:T9SS type A sorting domain-containing protein [Candidatus Cloacimonadota bacterium]
MKRLVIPVFLLCVGWLLNALVPPHPLYKAIVPDKPTSVSERYENRQKVDPDPLPSQIIVFMVDFPDMQFVSTPSYPDYLVHDYNYFKRLMLHVSDYWSDASHGQYELYENIRVYESVVRLPQDHFWYGNDEYSDERMVRYFEDLVASVDADVDFSEYQGIMTIYAGAGQESDIDGLRTNEIWSTFLSRKDLREINDPDNDEYQGILTNDGVYVKELAIVAETEFQDYFPTEGFEANSYLFSNFGVTLHQFGKLLGLPTLFDNVSSNGRSQGIGNYGIMGSGSWNGNGYIPALPCAWSRYYLGWENAIEINVNQVDIPIDQTLDKFHTNPLMYKVPISETEYFLVECRSQNPDGSYYNGTATFTFDLVENQTYYPPDPNNPDAPLQPKFDFMTNRYLNCEWDIALPGLGGPAVGSAFEDNSGIFIWHIDELVIDALFSPDYEVNQVNSYATHKGVDLEEADGVQNLDTAAINPNMYGGPFDSFRANNNDYFGFDNYNGQISQPTAVSYYGGIPLEIYDISSQSTTMSFSTRFQWSLSTNYIGENTIPAASLDYDNDGVDEIFYPMPNGAYYLWKGEELFPGFPGSGATQLSEFYSYDNEFNRILVPYGSTNTVSLLCMEHASPDSGLVNLNGLQYNKKWAGPIVITEEEYLLPLNHTNDHGSSIIVLDKNFDLKAEVVLEDSLLTNIAWKDGNIYALTDKEEYTTMYKIYQENGVYSFYEFQSEVGKDDYVKALFCANIRPENNDVDMMVIQCTDRIYFFTENEFVYPNCIGFVPPIRYSPIMLPYETTGLLSFGDMDKNGSLDIIAGWENGIAVYGYNGQLLNEGLDIVSPADTTGVAGGAFPADIDGDGKLEIIGNFSLNRMYVWEDNFRVKRGYPNKFSERSRTYPFLHTDADGNTYLMSAVDNGKLFRKVIESSNLEITSSWYAEYGNLQRTASYTGEETENIYTGTKTFVKDEVYVYPNPYSSITGDELKIKLMVSKNIDVEIKVFDIAANCIYKDKIACQAYMSNTDKIKLNTKKISSGVYFIVLKAGNEKKILKFAIEK